MNRIVMAKADDSNLNRSELEEVFRFRHQVFHDRLGWEVQSRQGLEWDGYDQLQPVYMVARNQRHEVEGYWRFLPTTGPYMLKDTFPQLLRGEAAPQQADVWEISRFAVAADPSEGRVQASLNPVTFAMIRAAWDFAEKNDLSAYVFVTSVALERLFRRLGLPVRRFGDGKAQKVGHVLSVACRVEVNEQFRQVAYPDFALRDAFGRGAE